MTKRLLFILSFALVVSGSAMAQTKNITNADLDKFREKRQRAEREYRENYEKLGMPSPEELARQNELKRRENAETAARYRAERLQEEQIQAQHEQSEAAARNYFNQPPNNYANGYTLNNFGYQPYNYSGDGFGNRSYQRRFPPRRSNDNRNYLPPIRVLTPANIVKLVPLTTTRTNFPRGRH